MADAPSDVSLASGARSDARRIVPEPPTPLAPDAESLEVWGFRDSGFMVNEAGQVEFRGARYPISGKVIPNLLPWAEGILGLRVDPFDRNVSQYPTGVPERRASPALEAALAGSLEPARVSSEARVRLRHGHAVGRGEEDDVAVSQRSLFRGRECKLHTAAQVRVHVGDGQAVFLAGRDGSQFHVGMLRQQTQQFDAGIAGAADDANLDAGVRCLGHDECSSENE